MPYFSGALEKVKVGSKIMLKVRKEFAGGMRERKGRMRADGQTDGRRRERRETKRNSALALDERAAAATSLAPKSGSALPSPSVRPDGPNQAQGDQSKVSQRML